MPLKRYDPKTKAAFLKAATDIRAAGKPWADAHVAAKAAGYPGTVKGIIRMLEKAGSKSTKSATPKATAKPIAKPAPAAKAPASRPAVGKRYSPAVKSAILSAAIAARGAGTWADAHIAAKGAGYRGSVQGIVKMIRSGNQKKRVRKPTMKRGPVRPKRSGKPVIKRNTDRSKGTGKRLGRPPMKHVSVNGFGSIQAAVDRIVSERVRTTLDKAIAMLKAAI